MVIEPLVQAAAGMIMHPPGYLRGVRELTRKYDVLLIADEVAVGFGRTGTMFACEHEGVTPDLFCLAKGLTGGYLPMAATLATDEIWQAFLGTYAESEDVLSRPHLRRQPAGRGRGAGHARRVRGRADARECCQPKIARLAEHLARIAHLPHVGDVRQRGLIAAIELVRDRATKEPYPWEEKRGLRVCDYARGQGVLAAAVGQRDRDHAAAGDSARRARPHRRGAGRRHSRGHRRLSRVAIAPITPGRCRRALRADRGRCSAGR